MKLVNKLGVGIAAWLAGCGPATPPPQGKASSESAEVAPSKLVSEWLASFAVVAPGDRASLARGYAQQTGLQVEESGPSVRIGPFLSYYEAAFVAGLTPGARVELREHYDDAMTPEPWKPMAKGRAAEYAGARRIFNERFVMVTFTKPGTDPADESSKLRELELYQTSANGPRLLAKLPPKDLRPAAGTGPKAEPEGMLEASGGMVVLKTSEGVAFLQILNEKKEGATKAERVVGWRWGLDVREVVFEQPFLSLKLERSKPEEKPGAAKKTPEKTPEKGSEGAPERAELLVTRVDSATNASFVSYRVRLRFLAAAKNPEPSSTFGPVRVELNEWTHERWKDKSPLPDLAELESVERLGQKDFSLE